MIVIDVETVKRTDLPDELFPSLEDIKAPSNYKDEAKIKEYSEKKLKETMQKLSLSSIHNQICSFALLAAKTGEDPTVMCHVLNNETELLSQLRTNLEILFEAGYAMPFITFNGTRFDLSNLIAAFMRRRLPIPIPLKEAWTQRYNPVYHTDLYKLLGEEGSLHDWSVALGIKPPVGKGDMVQGWFDGDDYESIKVHNVSDVWSTYEIYKRWIL